MNDICFQMYNLQFVPEACVEAENSVKNSIGGLGELARKLEQEITDFSEHSRHAILNIQAYISEIKALIDKVDQKITSAQNKIQKELPPPQKPSIPEKATSRERDAIASAYHKQVSETDEKNAEIRRQNQRIDEYISRCNRTKPELERLIADLHALESSTRSETESVSSAAHELLRKTRDTFNQSTVINTAMSEYFYVFQQLVESAMKLYELQPASVRGYSYIDKLFVIKNTHDHFATPESSNLDFSSHRSISSESAEDPPSDPDEELLIKAKDAEAFFAAAQKAKHFKMPSSNLHKLGGKAFTAKMEELGYTTVAQSDGALIDHNGMIHWEKKDE